MIYRVDISKPATADAETALLWIRAESAEKAAGWFQGLTEAVMSLEEFRNGVHLRPKAAPFRSKCGSFFTVRDAGNTGFCSESRSTRTQTKMLF